MANHYLISKGNWDKVLARVIEELMVYAPFVSEGNQEYQLVENEQDISQIVYNKAKPASPLKTFFLPVKENVVTEPAKSPGRVILGVPSCDLAGLDLLDIFYMEEPYVDPYYKEKRENTILIGTDCFSAQEHCHCTTYGVNPFPEKNHDLRLSLMNDQVLLSAATEKGESFLKKWCENGQLAAADENAARPFTEPAAGLGKDLSGKNKHLPGYERTGVLIGKSSEEIWEKYARDCVSCGACATICPTCTCFLLIDRPDFDKVRQLDACQYPGFARVAAGEDPLKQKYERFRNRYLCKYVWRPEKFSALACTGCGRCIEACIGRINKNELFAELSV